MALSLFLPFLVLFAAPQGLDSLKEELHRGETLLKKREEEYQRQKEELEGILKRKQEVRERLSQLNLERDELSAKERALGTTIATLEAEIRQWRGSLERMSALAYSLFAGGMLDRILRFQSLEEGVRRKGEIYVVSQAIQNRFGEIRALLEQLRKDKEELARTREELERKGKELKEEERELEALEELQRERLDALKSELGFRRRYVQELRGELKDLLLRFAPDLTSQKIVLREPVEAPLLMKYGKQLDPVFRVEIFHPGWTYRVPPGTVVRAAAPGQVLYYGWVRGYGNLLILKHPGGFYTLYGYLQESRVKAGEEVSEGDPVGVSGDSGSLYGPALHFEIRKGKEPLNPALFVRRER